MRPSELPIALLRSHHGMAASATAATTPAVRFARRAPSTPASRTPAIAPARATATQMYGDASPSGAVIVVRITGSGFHDGPWTVLRSRWAISRPQMIPANGSYVGAEGSSRLTNPSARLPTIVATGRDTRRPVLRA